jgi:KDO2-lipid IV(A) lauroyltransferase
MEWVLIGFLRMLLPVFQALPLPWVARWGRIAGGWAWAVDGRHRRVAEDNLAHCYPEWDVQACREMARENFRRLGENYLSALRSSTMSHEDLRPYLNMEGMAPLRTLLASHTERSSIGAVGHFGNFELYARMTQVTPGWQGATTFRGLRQEYATRWMQQLREKSGCLYFERRRDAEAMKVALRTRRLLLGLLADQHDGRGVRVPFLGREASTSAAPAVLALRYGGCLFTAFCFRTALAQWSLEFGDEIGLRGPNGRARGVADILKDINTSFERAIRRDPANWFWVHRRWKDVRQ